MDIQFRSKRIEKLCNSEKEMRKRLGPRDVEKLKQRLAELKAADTLDDMRNLPGADCHELTQDRDGELAVSLVHPRRLVFEPGHNPVPTKADGGLDWTRVTSITVLEIVDYH